MMSEMLAPRPKSSDVEGVMLRTFRTPHIVLVPSLLLAACTAPAGSGDDPFGSGSNSGSGSTGGDGDKGDGDNGDGDITIIPSGCGDGVVQEGEYCDDGNEVSGDGCTAACQIELDYMCPTPGAPCQSTVACGNAILSSTEACDDGNTVGGDGCSADCGMIEPGYQCRVPGALCVPFCGDGVLTGAENCDDLNAISGDGCSSTCLTEPGYSCVGTVCTASDCGNGVVEAGESCDAGAANGLFYGDGTGCSKTCTQEPVCRDAQGATTACTTACGDGNIDEGETCDDGNAVDGDGCSSTCQSETGFTCTPVEKKDTTDCTAGAGECLVLPIIYRDFDGEHVAATGHPDFFYLSSGSRLCVPNASGQQDNTTVYPGTNGSSACWSSDSTDLCQGIVMNTLGADGKPQLNAANTTCACRFTDWDATGLTTAVAPTTCNSGGENQPKWYQTDVKVVDSAASFAQWFNDDATVNTTVVGTLELAAIGGDLYQYSSSNGLTVYDDIRMANPGGGTLSSGFFPLEDQTRAKVCNIWPYWANNPTCVADDGAPVGAQWDPSANMGAGNFVKGITGVKRNFYFTTEVRYLFRFAGGERLSFFGDDDVFVFINGVLALDLGAPHERLSGQLTLPAGPGGATYAISAVDNTIATPVTTIPIDSGTSPDLGMTPGNTYEIAIFHADRHPRESNYQLTLQGFTTNQSSCVPTCGDSVATTGEECDLGPANSDTEYGGCTTECKFGPFCGDGITTEGVEECDLGRDNNAQYGQEGCTSGCLLPHFCGDGKLDGAFGEECDDGDNNGLGACQSNCTLVVR